MTFGVVVVVDQNVVHLVLEVERIFLRGFCVHQVVATRTEVDIVKLDCTFDMSSDGLRDSSAIYPAWI